MGEIGKRDGGVEDDGADVANGADVGDVGDEGRDRSAGSRADEDWC